MRLLLSACLLACHPVHDLSPPPADADQRTAILRVTAPEATSSWAIDLDEPEYPDFSFVDEVSMTVAHLRCTPSQLGLEVGPLRMRDAPGRRELPPADVELTSSFVAGAQTGWDTSEVRLVERVDLREGHLCDRSATRFTPYDPSFPAPAGSRAFALPLSSTRALVVTRFGRFFDVDVRGSSSPVALSSSTPHLAGVSGEGEVLLLGSDGQVVRGALDDLQPAPLFPITTSSAVVLAGWPEPIAATDDGRILRLASGGWTLLRSEAPGDPQVVALGPDRFVVVGLSADALEWEGDQWRSHALPEPATALFREGDRAIIGTGSGRLYALGADEPLTDAPVVEGPITFGAPFRDGIIYGGVVGLLARNVLIEKRPALGACPIELYPFVQQLLPLSEDALLVVEAPNDTMLLLKGFVDEDPRPECFR